MTADYDILGLMIAALSGAELTLPKDAIKTVMCGASAVQVVAGVLRSGPERRCAMRVEMESWMAEQQIHECALSIAVDARRRGHGCYFSNPTPPSSGRGRRAR